MTAGFKGGLEYQGWGGGEFGMGKISNGAIWQNNIVPNFVMVFKDRSHLCRCHGGYKVPRGLYCSSSGFIDDHHHG